MATTISITALDPKSAPPADKSFRAVVSLYWPYSSSTKQCALLLADPDFRLRSRRGQVRVRFTGPSATAVAQGKVGIGDEVVLELEGARWAAEASGVSTPGKSVEGELVYSGQLDLLLVKKAGSSALLDQSIRANEVTPPSEDCTIHGSPLTGPQTSSSSNRLSNIDLIPIYSSPAFVKRQRLSGEPSLKGAVYDPFADIERELQDEQPRKRQRISDVSSWRFADRSPSPEKQRTRCPVAAIHDGFQQASTKSAALERDVADAAINQKSAEISEAGTDQWNCGNAAGVNEGMSLETPPGVHTAAMPPPPLPKLRLPADPSISTAQQEQGLSIEDGPSIPKLQPVPSHNLPLPSPFAVEPTQLPFEPHMAAAGALPTQPEDVENEDSSDGSIRLEINPSIVALAEQSQQLAEGKSVVTDTEMLDTFPEMSSATLSAGQPSDLRHAAGRKTQESHEHDDDEELAHSTGIYADGTSTSDTGYIQSLTEDISDTEEDEEMEELYSREIQRSATATPVREGIKRHDWAAESDTYSRTQRSSEEPERSPKSIMHSHPTASSGTPVRQRESKNGAVLADQPPMTQHDVQSDTNDAVEKLVEVANRFSNNPPATEKTFQQATAYPALEARQVLKSTKVTEPEPEGRKGLANPSQHPQQHSSEGPATRAKTPPPTKHVQRLFGFGMDGTSDNSRRSTASIPQSEKDRVMKRTFNSLFGFKASPSPEMGEAEQMVQPPAPSSKQHDIANTREAGFGFMASAPMQPPSATDGQLVVKSDDVKGDATLIDKEYAAPAGISASQMPTRQSYARQETSTESYPGPASIHRGKHEATEPGHLPSLAENDLSAPLRSEQDLLERPQKNHDSPDEDGGAKSDPEPNRPDAARSSQAEVSGTKDSAAKNDFEPEDGDHQDAGFPLSQPAKKIFRAQASISQKPDTHQATTLPPHSSAPLDSLGSEKVLALPTSTPPRPAQVKVIDLGSIDDESESVSVSTGQLQQVMNRQTTDPGAVYNDGDLQSRAWSSSSTAIQASPKGDSMNPSIDAEMLDDDSGAREGPAMTEETTQQESSGLEADLRNSLTELMQAGGSHATATPIVEPPSYDYHPPSTGGFAETYRYFSFQSTTSDGQSVGQGCDDNGEEMMDNSLQNAQREPQNLSTETSERFTQTTNEPLHSTQLAVPEVSAPHVSFAHANPKDIAPLSAEDNNEPALSNEPLGPAASQEAAHDQQSETQHRLGSQPFQTQITALSPGVTILPTPEGTDARPQHIVPEAARKERLAKKSRRSGAATVKAPVRRSLRKAQEAGQLTSMEETTPVSSGDQRREHTPDRRLSTGSSVDSNLLSPAKPIPVRRSPRKLQAAAELPGLDDIEVETVPSQSLRTRGSTRKLQAKIEVGEMKRQDIEDEQSVSPAAKGSARTNSLRPETTMDRLAHGEEVSTNHKVPTARRSFGTRLGHVPDVISAWFSPRRSSRQQGDGRTEARGDEGPSRRGASVGLRTASAYYVPLSGLDKKLNPSSQSGIEDTTDILAVVVNQTKTPEQAKGGPKDYFTVFRVTDTSLRDDESTLVEVFRPWHATLPVAEPGDVVLLRSFTVKSRKRQPYLLSSEQSAWLVWRYDNHGKAAMKTSPRRPSTGAREEVNGPPVEFGDEERKRATELRAWWQGLAGVRAAGRD